MKEVSRAIALSATLTIGGCGGMTGDEGNTIAQSNNRTYDMPAGQAHTPQRASVGVDGIDGKVFRLYQAAFDRKPDSDGLDYWVAHMNNGMTLEQVATGFINSVEFKFLYGGNPSTEQFVTLLYQNVLHRSPDPLGFANWTTALDSRALSREQVLIGFSESPENKLNTQSTAPTTTQGNSAIAISPAIKSGDSFTYFQTSTTQSSGATSPIKTTYYWTKEFQTIHGDGSHTYTNTYSNETPGLTYSSAADGSLIGTGPIGSTQPNCTYSGKNAGSTAPYAVGQTWDNSWTRRCSVGGVTGSSTNKGSIVGIESVAVPAGTFSAYKEVFTRTDGITRAVTNSTCWRDVVLLQNVKCESTTTNATGVTVTDRQVLDSYILNGTPDGIPWTSRFAGSWTLNYSGSSSGTCSIFITDSTTASTAVLGTCTSSNQPGTYSMLGGMGAQGSAGFYGFGSTGSGIIPSFSAQFTSAATVSGTWSLGQTSGTWTATHK